MAIKKIAFCAQLHLQTNTAIPVKRAHIYELLASLFSFTSYAAFRSKAIFTDAGIGEALPGIPSAFVGRVASLGYSSAEGDSIAQSLNEYVQARQLSFIRLGDLVTVLMPPRQLEEDDDDDDWEADSDEGQDEADPALNVKQRIGEFRASSLLMDGLEQAAAAGNPEAHFVLAALYRCPRPNSYLYDESLKGRILTKIEQDWADTYLRLKPDFERYEHHLRQSAMGGMRQAAAEFADAFGSAEFHTLAEQGVGPVDAKLMAKIAPSHESRNKWLRVSAEEGSQRAMDTLAQGGDAWALRQLAKSGDIDAIRDLASQALETDIVEAWMWQHLAKRLGTDLQASTMRAYHDRGPHADEYYDDDYGGAMYVDGDEGLKLPAISEAQNKEAKKLAAAFFRENQLSV